MLLKTKMQDIKFKFRKQSKELLIRLDEINEKVLNLIK